MTVQEQALDARVAAQVLATATRAQKDRALHAMADALSKAETTVLEANAGDVQRAEEAGTSPAIVDRLRLTADRAAICLKSGNAVLLRGSSSAAASNAAVVEALRDGLTDAGLPADAVLLVPGPREVTDQLMGARGLVDVLIPRGGADLIDHVVRNSVVPVIETGVGNCHLYVDASADPAMALAILLNAKTQRPSVCNAVETLLVHADAAPGFLPMALASLAAAGVTVHGDGAVS